MIKSLYQNNKSASANIMACKSIGLCTRSRTSIEDDQHEGTNIIKIQDMVFKDCRLTKKHSVETLGIL